MGCAEVVFCPWNGCKWPILRAFSLVEVKGTAARIRWAGTGLKGRFCSGETALKGRFLEGKNEVVRTIVRTQVRTKTCFLMAGVNPRYSRVLS